MITWNGIVVIQTGIRYRCRASCLLNIGASAGCDIKGAKEDRSNKDFTSMARNSGCHGEVRNVLAKYLRLFGVQRVHLRLERSNAFFSAVKFSFTLALSISVLGANVCGIEIAPKTVSTPRVVATISRRGNE